jgi:hypothetical protein
MGRVHGFRGMATIILRVCRLSACPAAGNVDMQFRRRMDARDD